ncbi:hypothetical protein SMKI_07G3100 [Saccharomyces mikatae IFO 1815]|uniref:Cnn1p n=1 Tax=Saccharomyces mikatae IFO 1815 TaxID=226126 RepID=A0AA35J0X9_SACMI|nr:uncharacterized protein SMKI_07G3100 [Saccharomyces mikatae IFO 1815]CAI4039326.1 hypothetical protein SMKI_07G3100 [Saccharomyces mikatae IFO 1815]
MSTPRKTAGDNEDTEISEIRTPFRERALEEQRLKDEILIRNTPGYRKLLSTSTKSHDILNKDPNEVRNFLQDLSQVLARKSQGDDTIARKVRARNLIDELTHEGNRIEQDGSLQGEGENTTDNNTSNGMQAGYTSLSQTIFSKLQEREKGLKSRKIDPIVIQDAPMIENEDEMMVNLPNNINDVSMDVLRASPGLAGDATEDSQVDDPESSFVMQQEERLPDSMPNAEEDEKEEQAEKEEYSLLSASDEELDDFEGEPVRLNIPAVRHSSVKPLQIMDLKHLTRQFLSENEIILPNQTWSTIQEESLNIMDFLKQRIGTLQKQDLVDSFIDMGIINNVDDMFELAHELLPLEFQSIIETYLF